MATTKPLVAASMIALLTLTACAGGDTLVFDFTEPAVDSASSIEFRVPDELVELSEAYTENRVYGSVAVTAVESDDPSRCAVKYQFDYVDGGLERLLDHIKDKISKSSRDDTVEKRMASILTGEPLDSIELAEDYSFAVVPLKCATSPTDAENTVKVFFPFVIETGTPFFARAEVAAMQGGKLVIHDTELRSWELDTNGNWTR